MSKVLRLEIKQKRALEDEKEGLLKQLDEEGGDYLLLKEEYEKFEREVTDKLSDLRRQVFNLESENQNFKKEKERLSLEKERLSGENKQLLEGTEQLSLKHGRLSQTTEQLSLRNEQLALENERSSQETEQLSLKNNQLLQGNEQLSLENKQLLQEVKQLTLKNEQLALENGRLSQGAEQLSSGNGQLSLENEQLLQEAEQLTLRNEQLSLENDQLLYGANQLSDEYEKLAFEKKLQEEALQEMKAQLELAHQTLQKKIPQKNKNSRRETDKKIQQILSVLLPKIDFLRDSIELINGGSHDLNPLIEKLKSINDGDFSGSVKVKATHGEWRESHVQQMNMMRIYFQRCRSDKNRFQVLISPKKDQKSQNQDYEWLKRKSNC